MLSEKHIAQLEPWEMQLQIDNAKELIVLRYTELMQLVEQQQTCLAQQYETLTTIACHLQALELNNELNRHDPSRENDQCKAA